MKLYGELKESKITMMDDESSTDDNGDDSSSDASETSGNAAGKVMAEITPTNDVVVNENENDANDNKTNATTT